MKAALFSLAVVLFSSASWPAQAASKFIEIPVGGWDPGMQIRKQHEDSIVDWIRRVDVHPEALSDNVIEVDLFDAIVRLKRTAGPRLNAAPDPVYVPAGTDAGAVAAMPSARLRWTGTMASTSTSTSTSKAPSSCVDAERAVRITEAADGQLRAIFDIGSFRYELQDGVLIRKDFRRLPREAPVRDVSPDALDAVSSDDVEQEAKSTVRVLFGYGTTALGDDREVVFAEMREAVCLANESFSHSGIKVELERAANVLSGYQETGVTQTLDDLVAGRRGALGVMHQVRDIEKADIVLMIIDTGPSRSVCGQSQRVLATKETAFAVVERNCLGATTSSLAHEIGHLFGADHEPANATVRPPRFSYGHGYKVPENAPGRWRTLMSYECSGAPCGRINLWSSPDLSHNGLPAGTKETHHNVRVLNETRGVIANFYPEP
nr:M12 family metallo-peptidase [Stenotrophomonas geniculata]